MLHDAAILDQEFPTSLILCTPLNIFKVYHVFLIIMGKILSFNIYVFPFFAPFLCHHLSCMAGNIAENFVLKIKSAGAMKLNNKKLVPWTYNDITLFSEWLRFCWKLAKLKQKPYQKEVKMYMLPMKHVQQTGSANLS